MRSNKKITISDIAKEAKVSISTVSRVLNSDYPVRPEKRIAVLKAVEALDYQPNVFAQGLASGQSKTIGVLTPFVNSPHYSEMMSGLIAELETANYSALFAETFLALKREQKMLQGFLARNIDGLIFLGRGASSNEVLIALQKQLPLIILGRTVPSLEDYCLQLDNQAGAYLAVEYLIRRGHYRIAHITGPKDENDSMLRLEGYRQALRDNDILIDENLIIEGNFTEKSGLLAIQTLITQGHAFSALFASNDQTAHGARLGLHRHGLRVPDDISVIGFDDQPNSAYMVPPLTTVRQPSREMGVLAGKSILRLLKGEPLPPLQIKTQLIMRESVGRYP